MTSEITCTGTTVATTFISASATFTAIDPIAATIWLSVRVETNSPAETKIAPISASATKLPKIIAQFTAAKKLITTP